MWRRYDAFYKRALDMTYRRWAILVVVFLIAFLIPELYSYFSGEPTLSQSVWMWSDMFWPLGLFLSFGMGLLCGHLWWGREIVVRETKLAFHDAPYDEVFDHKSLKLGEERALRETKKRAF